MKDTKTAHNEKAPELHRQAFRTSRLLDFLSEKELVAQIGHPRAAWPLVLVKESLDNALDACEEARIAPEVVITVDDRGLTITDNGPGIPPDVATDILDYSVRVSSREAYVSPCRRPVRIGRSTFVAARRTAGMGGGRVPAARRVGGVEVIGTAAKPKRAGLSSDDRLAAQTAIVAELSSQQRIGEENP